jgi:hypothetical protein
MTVIAVPHRSSHRYSNDFAEFKRSSHFGSENRAAVHRTVTKPHYGGPLAKYGAFRSSCEGILLTLWSGISNRWNFRQEKEVDDEETG